MVWAGVRLPPPGGGFATGWTGGATHVHGAFSGGDKSDGGSGSPTHGGDDEKEGAENVVKVIFGYDKKSENRCV